MTDVVAKGGQPDDAPPISKLMLPGQVVPNVRMYIRVCRYDVEDDAGEVHHPERMFEIFCG